MSTGVDERWVCEGYDNGRRAYILAYYKDGVRQCTMWGYRKPNGNVYRVYPRRLAQFGYMFPQVKDVSIFDVRNA